MKTPRALIFLLFLPFCPRVNAATLTVRPTTVSPNSAYAIYLDGESTVFDAVSVRITPGHGANFINIDDGLDGTTPRMALQAFAFVNALLEAPTPFGGRGLVVVDKNITERVLTFEASQPGGGPIDTRGNMFLANFTSESFGYWRAVCTLKLGGVAIGTLTALVIPEPASFSVALPWPVSPVGLSSSRGRHMFARSGK